MLPKAEQAVAKGKVVGTGHGERAGGFGLLAAILVFQLGTLSAHVTWISGIEAGLAENPSMLETGVAIQIAETLPLVWWLSRRSSAMHVSAVSP